MIEFANKIDYLNAQLSQDNEKSMTSEYSFDEALQYDFNNGGKIFDQLKINLGSNDLPSISCAAHKANIAVTQFFLNTLKSSINILLVSDLL